LESPGLVKDQALFSLFITGFFWLLSLEYYLAPLTLTFFIDHDILLYLDL